MVRSHSVMVWTHYPPKKSLVVVSGGEWVGGLVGGRTILMYSPGSGLWSLVLGPFGPDLGPDLDLTWDLDLDLSWTKSTPMFIKMSQAKCQQKEQIQDLGI